MGYTTITHSGGSHKNFTPDNTFDKIYLSSSWEEYTFSEIREMAENKWPGIHEDEFRISSDYIHTSCLGYDRYDSGDYTNYLIIQASEKYFDRNNRNVTNDCNCTTTDHDNQCSLFAK